MGQQNENKNKTKDWRVEKLDGKERNCDFSVLTQFVYIFKNGPLGLPQAVR